MEFLGDSNEFGVTNFSLFVFTVVQRRFSHNLCGKSAYSTSIMRTWFAVLKNVKEGHECRKAENHHPKYSVFTVWSSRVSAKE